MEEIKENNEVIAKVAINKTEAFWSGLKAKLISDNEGMARSIEINEYVLKMAEAKLLEFK